MVRARRGRNSPKIEPTNASEYSHKLHIPCDRTLYVATTGNRNNLVATSSSSEVFDRPGGRQSMMKGYVTKVLPL